MRAYLGRWPARSAPGHQRLSEQIETRIDKTTDEQAQCDHREIASSPLAAARAPAHPRPHLSVLPSALSSVSPRRLVAALMTVFLHGRGQCYRQCRAGRASGWPEGRTDEDSGKGRRGLKDNKIRKSEAMEGQVLGSCYSQSGI